mmetsp:Transcript_4933/g.7270  ORF Transcript_4933/g.7270 Transcript_4933/m.7270 type:complete len:105 (-) Transcript_4933:12-326(-)
MRLPSAVCRLDLRQRIQGFSLIKAGEECNTNFRIALAKLGGCQAYMKALEGMRALLICQQLPMVSWPARLFLLAARAVAILHAGVSSIEISRDRSMQQEHLEKE